MLELIKIIILYVITSIFELLGCYFVWNSIKVSKSYYEFAFGTVFLISYAIIPTIHGIDFGKSYILYGCIFVLVVIGWTNFKEYHVLDLYDWIASVLVLIATILYCMPRK